MKPIKTVTLNPAFDLHYDMEQFEAGKENYAQHVSCNAGGKGINISRALTVNGVKNTAYVVLGNENGAAFASELEKDGLCYVPVYTEGRIRENITLHPNGDRETRISLDTFGADADILDHLEHAMDTENPAGGLLAFAGRLPRGIDKEAAITFLQKQILKGNRLVVDSNSFTLDDLKKLRPWFIKPNEQEIAAALGREVTTLSDAANAAAELVARGVAEQVMVSLGGNGAVWSNGVQRVFFKVPKLEHPVSTIGAGDSTVAGLLAAYANGAEMAEALKNAVSFGTAACMTAGTLPPNAEDIKAVYAQVEIVPLQ